MVEELKKEIDAIVAEKLAARELEEQELANQSK